MGFRIKYIQYKNNHKALKKYIKTSFSEYLKENIDLLKYYGKVSKEEENWLVRTGRKSYSGGELRPIFYDNKMIGGISWNLGGIDYIEFLPKYKNKGYLKHVVNDNIENGVVKFVSASDELQSKLKNYGELSYDESTDITTVMFNNYLKENYLPSDAMGYDIGEFVYHITPKKNLNTIKKNGFIPKDGISINHKPFKNRLYFATSLIAAYDLSVNFNSYRDNDEYVIFKLDSKCINKGYEEDELFIHGIYVDYEISYSFVIDVINTSDLFNKFDDDDFDRF